jgi:hypothetical protein
MPSSNVDQPSEGLRRLDDRDLGVRKKRGGRHPRDAGVDLGGGMTEALRGLTGVVAAGRPYPARLAGDYVG